MRTALLLLVACAGAAPAPAPTVSNAPSPVAPEPAVETPTEKRQLPGTSELRSIELKAKTYRTEKNDLPPSAGVMPGPPTAICSSPNNELPARPRADWLADPGWSALYFFVEGPSLISYTWTRTSATTGYATATADFDCDGTYRVARVELSVDGNGNMRAHYPDRPTTEPTVRRRCPSQMIIWRGHAFARVTSTPERSSPACPK